MENTKAIFLHLLLIFVFSSCSSEKYKKFDDKEVAINSYTGEIYVTSGMQDPAGDFTGNGDSGVFSFAWNNPQSKASANFDKTSDNGSVQLIIYDAEGSEVLNKTRLASGSDSFSGVSKEGVAGMWLVEFTFTDFNGDGSYSLHPGD